MATSVGSEQVAVDHGPAASEGDGFDLDVRIVEGDAGAALLLAGTDDGCDTVRGSDC
jgi:FxLD family lantipeptide